MRETCFIVYLAIIMLRIKHMWNDSLYDHIKLICGSEALTCKLICTKIYLRMGVSRSFGHSTGTGMWCKWICKVAQFDTSVHVYIWEFIHIESNPKHWCKWY